MSRTDADLLAAYLTAQRNHVLTIADALTAREDVELRRPVLPSGWTIAGLVQHLAFDVERFWFGAVMAGDPQTIAYFDDEPDAWNVPADVDPKSVIAGYRHEIARADEIIAATSLDAAPAWWPDTLFGSMRFDSLRHVLLHVIVETSCHAGHLDAARELIDGGQWLVLTS